MNERWVQLVAISECRPNTGRLVVAAGRELAVFHLSDPDRFVVTQNECPHAGGSLSAGELAGNKIICPWHAWAFDFDTGLCVPTGSVRLRRYETRIEDGWLWAKLPGRSDPLPPDVDALSP